MPSDNEIRDAEFKKWCPVIIEDAKKAPKTTAAVSLIRNGWEAAWEASLKRYKPLVEAVLKASHDEKPWVESLPNMREWGEIAREARKLG